MDFARQAEKIKIWKRIIEKTDKKIANLQQERRIVAKRIKKYNQQLKRQGEPKDNGMICPGCHNSDLGMAGYPFCPVCGCEFLDLTKR
jgi:hypothetical protein